MEPFGSFFRVLYLKAIEIDQMRKTCMATLCAENYTFDVTHCRSFETLHCNIFFSYTDCGYMREQEGKQIRSALAPRIGTLSTLVFL